MDDPMDGARDGTTSEVGPDEPLTIETRQDDGELCLALRGELDPHTAPELRDRLDQAFARGHHRIGLELSELTFMDSSGLRVILSAHKEAASRGGSLVLRSPSPTARRLLDITGLLDHIEVDR